MSYTPLIQQLIQAFCCLPGVGPKSAQRMVFHLLERNRVGAHKLADLLKTTMDEIKNCSLCRNFSDKPTCQICLNPTRHTDQLCILEQPADVLAIEQTAVFHGLYFVLMGHLSPIDGIGPNDIGMDILQARLAAGEFNEIILATNPTIEGEATAHYIAEIAKHYHVKISRIAYGVPMGSELVHIDVGTLTRALASRDDYTLRT